MTGRRLKRIEAKGPPARAILAGRIGALLGLTVLILSAGVTSEVRLQYTMNDPIPVVPFPLYAGLGTVTIGGVIGFLYQRYQAVTPPLASTVVFVSALSQTWWTIRTREKPMVAELIPQPLDHVTALEYVMLGWSLMLSGVLLLAGIELYLTRRQPE